MTAIHNEITVNAPIEKIWEALTEVELLEKYDPTVKKSIALSTLKSGMGAKRKVHMLDGKNWFDEEVTEYIPNVALTYTLTACTFPVHKLKHSYSFEKVDNQTKVKQVMQYEMKFGFLGKIMDTLMVRKQSDISIKKFFAGLKSFTEKK